MTTENRVAVPSSENERLLQQGWASLPASYRIPDVAPTLAEARAWCKHLAETHYENFHVASWFLPKKFRPHFHAIYAYCRVSDDLGDETGNREQSLALLDLWSGELDACSFQAGPGGNAIRHDGPGTRILPVLRQSSRTTRALCMWLCR